MDNAVIKHELRRIFPEGSRDISNYKKLLVSEFGSGAAHDLLKDIQQECRCGMAVAIAIVLEELTRRH
jgi:hypothetical protein